MKIDMKVEPVVREILTGIVKQEPERFAQAMQAVNDNESAATVLQLGVAIGTYVLYDQHDGARPTPEEIDEIADATLATYEWSTLTKEQAVETITAMVDQRQANLSPTHVLVAAPFFVAAYGLAAGADDDEWWFSYLDRVEAALERP